MSSNNTDTGDTTIFASTAEIMNATTDAVNAAVAPREALIKTAINFLQNAKVRHTTLMQKRQFLQSKGLTNEEVELACQRAGVFTDDPNMPPSTVINIGSSTHPQLVMQPRQNAFGPIKEILHNVALISGVAYAIYLFWKKYVEPYIFGRKKKPIDDALEDIDKKVDTRLEAVNIELKKIKDQLQEQQREQRQALNQEFNIFRSDIEAIKGLLLNRKQFAAPLTTGPASIPAWQLASAPHRLHTRHSQSDDNEKVDDAGSGSGSSETEVVTKNSDSSLEIV